MKAMIIPGNGNADMSEIWYPYVKKEIEKLGITVIAKNMPDPELARSKYWVPFIEQQIGEGEDIILIGHSSGAIAIMRYLEKHKILGAVIVGAYHTTLGIESEKASGYFEQEWEWNKIIEHAKWIIQFGAKDDPFIPYKETQYVHKRLNTEFHLYSEKGHFLDTNFPELIAVIKEKIRTTASPY